MSGRVVSTIAGDLTNLHNTPSPPFLLHFQASFPHSLPERDVERDVVNGWTTPRLGHRDAWRALLLVLCTGTLKLENTICNWYARPDPILVGRANILKLGQSQRVLHSEGLLKTFRLRRCIASASSPSPLLPALVDASLLPLRIFPDY